MTRLASKVGAFVQSGCDAFLAARPLITAITDPFSDGGSIEVDGKAFGPAKGEGRLLLADASTLGASGTVVEQSVSSWIDTKIMATAVQGALAVGTVYAFVEHDCGHRSDAKSTTLQSAGVTAHVVSTTGYSTFDSGTLCNASSFILTSCTLTGIQVVLADADYPGDALLKALLTGESSGATVDFSSFPCTAGSWAKYDGNSIWYVNKSSSGGYTTVTWEMVWGYGGGVQTGSFVAGENVLATF